MAFDDAEPGAGHFARFEEKMNASFGRKQRFTGGPVMLRIAAVLLVLLTVSVFVFDFATKRLEKRSAGMAMETEVRDAENFYNEAAASRLGDIKRLACCDNQSKEIYSEASGELQKLDANASELRKALRENPNEERIQSALIRNQQMKEKITQNILNKLNNSKK